MYTHSDFRWAQIQIFFIYAFCFLFVAFFNFYFPTDRNACAVMYFFCIALSLPFVWKFTVRRTSICSVRWLHQVNIFVTILFYLDGDCICFISLFVFIAKWEKTTCRLQNTKKLKSTSENIQPASNEVAVTLRLWIPKIDRSPVN